MSQGFIYILGLLFSIPFMVAFFMIVIHMILVMAYFKNLLIKEIIKLACIMAFKDVLNSILMVIIIVVFLSLDVALYFVMAIVGISLPIYLIVKLSYKKYIKIYRKVETNNE